MQSSSVTKQGQCFSVRLLSIKQTLKVIHLSLTHLTPSVFTHFWVLLSFYKRAKSPSTFLTNAKHLLFFDFFIACSYINPHKYRCIWISVKLVSIIFNFSLAIKLLVSVHLSYLLTYSTTLNQSQSPNPAFRLCLPHNCSSYTQIHN